MRGPAGIIVARPNVLSNCLDSLCLPFPLRSREAA